VKQLFTETDVCAEKALDVTFVHPLPAAGVLHFIPVVSAESAVKTCPFVPIANRETVSAAVAAIRSPFASTIAFAIAAFAVVFAVVAVSNAVFTLLELPRLSSMLMMLNR